MAVAGALRKVQATRARAAFELPFPWKARRRRAGIRRVLWVTGLAMGLCIVAGLVWWALWSPVERK